MLERRLTEITTLIATAPNLMKFGSPNLKRIILLLTVALFVGGIVLSVYHQPDIFSNLDWRPLIALMAFAVPMTILLNALQFLISARLINRNVSFGKALEIVVIGTAANMLPLPGGALTRLVGLKAAGGSYREGAAVTGLIALGWLGAALTVAGAAIALLNDDLFGPLFIVAGIIVMFVALAAMVRVSRDWLLSFLTTTVAVLFVVLDATGIYLCLIGLGADAGYLQASAFVVAGVVGSAVSIVPAGLGIREAVSAALAPVVGLAASVGFLAASLNRLLGMLVMLPLAFGLAFRFRRTESVASGRNTQP